MALLTPEQIPPPQALRLQLKNDTKAEVTISASGIVRNESLWVKKTSQDGKTYEVLEEKFDPKAYCFVDDLKSMDSDARVEYVSKIRFEIIIDAFALVSGGTGTTVLDQLARIKPILSHIQQVTVEIRIPTNASNLSLPETSPQRKFFQRFIVVLRSLQGLQSMDIILALPKGHNRWSYDYILPFYDLETFTDWRVWY